MSEWKRVESEFGPRARLTMLESKMRMVTRHHRIYEEEGVDVHAWLARLSEERIAVSELIPRASF